MWDRRVVVVEVRSGRYTKRLGLPFVEKEYYYLSGESRLGIVREEHKVELNDGRCDGMLGICQVSPFLRAVRT